MERMRTLIRKTLGVSKCLVIGAGVVAAVDLAFVDSPRPPLCIVQVDGSSMSPTLHPGDRLFVARLPWERGSIVIADVGESHLVVKRVVVAHPEFVGLMGDNRELSESFVVPPDHVKGVLVCRLPFPTFASRAEAAESDP
jgi:phage repressor protein C with HTH and peptisase S24 domain